MFVSYHGCKTARLAIRSLFTPGITIESIICYLAGRFSTTARALIGYFVDTWRLTIKLFPTKSLWVTELQNPWRQRVTLQCNPPMLTDDRLCTWIIFNLSRRGEITPLMFFMKAIFAWSIYFWTEFGRWAFFVLQFILIWKLWQNVRLWRHNWWRHQNVL